MKHPFDGRRVYNGCPDSTMQRMLDAERVVQKKLTEAIEKLGVRVRVTYFPMEGKYQAFSSEHQPVSDMCHTVTGALHSALKKLEAR